MAYVPFTDNNWYGAGTPQPGMPTVAQIAALSPSGSMSDVSAVPSVIPGMGGAGSFGAPAGGVVPNQGLGFNVPTAQLALSGLSTIGNLWAAWQQAKLAKKQFNYTKDITETNLGNQIKTYNTTLADRVASRAKVEGMSSEQAQSYLDANKLNRKGT